MQACAACALVRASRRHARQCWAPASGGAALKSLRVVRPCLAKEPEDRPELQALLVTVNTLLEEEEKDHVAPGPVPGATATVISVPMAVPSFKASCASGRGYGVAACASPARLATSNDKTNTLSIWSLPAGGDGGQLALTLVCTLGGAGGLVDPDP
jgi:hypothetical protein